jgi:phosphoribosylaminoimidazole (AIR) synthetase
MKRVQILGGIDDADAYRLWNMGQGMVLIVDRSEVARIIAALDKQSYSAKIVGEITGTPTIQMQTLGSAPTTLAVPVT